MVCTTGKGKGEITRLLEEILEKRISYSFYRENLMEIYGFIMHYDGTMYEGQLKEGKKHGCGKMRIPMKNYEYEGEFEAGFRSGKGRETIGMDVIYEGEFKRNLKDGEGVLLTPDYRYDGSFKKNRFDGYGKCVWKDNREYEGLWQAGLKHGNGEFRWPDGRVFKGTIVFIK